MVPKTSVPTSPTIEMTKQEMEMIKTGRQVDKADTTEIPPVSPRTSEIKANVPVMPPSQFDDLFPDDDDEEDDTDESVADDGEQEQEYDGEEELDPRLKKIIMVSSIAIAVVLAILAILLIGKIAGWNILGGKGKTEESTDVITTEERTTQLHRRQYLWSM